MEIANAQPEEGKRNSPRRRSPVLKGKERVDNKKKDPRARILDTRDRVGRFNRYTPLNASRSQIWKEVAMMEMKKVERPRPIFDRGGLDKSKYCAFHDGPGHTTNQCWDLRDAVEKFVRDGRLRQYVIKTQGSRNNKKKLGNRNWSKSPVPEKKNKQERNQKNDPNYDEFSEVEFDCNVISGALGGGGGGDTVSARRKYLKEVLSIRDHPKFKEDPTKPDPHLLYFTKEDMCGVLLGHVDGLVIAGTLANCRVRKIFVDVGSYADIILWDTLKKMNLDEEDFKPFKMTLIAFNGEHTSPKGYIDLILTLGTKAAFRSERVRFIVADFPSEYNIILGRPTIHQWDMLVSTKHQKIKMVSNKNEIITVCGDQKESRGCYFDTVKENEGGRSSPPRIHPGDKTGKNVTPQHSRKPVNMVELDIREEIMLRPEPDGELEDLTLGKEPGQFT
ncbi:uncharacterized protein LOC133317846 [Gastrolobium bilobum]|uniref:uncharacterized protein LOC133317846 n=1 Tax=Gastrolobium bilobum TaxID=150636 RepID=UPI002AB17B0C|nr:uncharacterized protein LOC133317846 [Gastrolobium bilobum]